MQSDTRRAYVRLPCHDDDNCHKCKDSQLSIECGTLHTHNSSHVQCGQYYMKRRSSRWFRTVSLLSVMPHVVQRIWAVRVEPHETGQQRRWPPHAQPCRHARSPPLCMGRLSLPRRRTVAGCDTEQPRTCPRPSRHAVHGAQLLGGSGLTLWSMLLCHDRLTGMSKGLLVSAPRNRLPGPSDLLQRSAPRYWPQR